MATSATSTTSTDKSLVSQKFALYNRANGAHPFLFFFPGSGKLETEVCQNTKDKMSYENKNNNSKKKKKMLAGQDITLPSLPAFQLYI